MDWLKWLIALSLTLLAFNAVAERKYLRCTNASTLLDLQATQSPNDGVLVSAMVRVEVPSFIWFRVGSTFNTVDTVEFDGGTIWTGANSGVSSGLNNFGVGTGIAINATGSGTANNPLIVKLQANCGQTVIKARPNDLNGLVNSNGDYISFAEILSFTTVPALSPPVLANAETSVQPSPTSGVLTDLNASWYYKYANNNLPSKGIYNGVVTYTASCP